MEGGPVMHSGAPNAVPFMDLAASLLAIRAEVDAAVARVLDSGWFLLGKELTAFEGEWATYCQAAHAVGVANGMDALVLALQAVGVGPGDQVIVPANTYIATWLAVLKIGAEVVAIEPRLGTYNLDPDLVERAITTRTRALLPVHLYGQPAEMEPLLALARRHGLKVVEDAAQAHGAVYHGQRLGAHGDAVCWSFYPTKNLGALGDAGAVTTNDPAIADRLRVLRNYGSRQRYICEVIGHNSRMEELHAAILRVKLAHLDDCNRRRAALAERYLAAFAGLPLVLPQVAEGMSAVWHLFVVRTPRRDELAKFLAARGIGSIVHYPVPPHRQEACTALGYGQGSLPITERIHREVLSLPLHPHLEEARQDLVIAAVRDWAKNSG